MQICMNICTISSIPDLEKLKVAAEKIFLFTPRYNLGTGLLRIKKDGKSSQEKTAICDA